MPSAPPDAARTSGWLGGRARSWAPPRDPRQRGSELGYARTGHVGCTLRNAGAPEGPGQRRRASGSDRTCGGGKRGGGGASATPVRVPDRRGPELGLSCPTSWQRTGALPLQPSAKTAAHRLSLRSRKRDSAPGVLWSRVRISWDHRRPLPPRLAAPLDPRLPLLPGVSACVPRGPARKRRGVSLLNWNVGLDYTARGPNCQSANAFVEPRQTRAPRLRKVPSNTEPRVPSHPLASRASSRPRSAPSTIA